MIKNGIKTIKHIAIGMAGGTIIGIVLCCFFSCKNKIKNKASRTVRAIGDIVEQIIYIFKNN